MESQECNVLHVGMYFASWNVLSTFVTERFLLLMKRQVREISVCVGLPGHLRGLTAVFCPHGPCFSFREDSASVEVASVVVLSCCPCTPSAPAERGGRLSLGLSNSHGLLVMFSLAKPGDASGKESKKGEPWGSSCCR